MYRNRVLFTLGVALGLAIGDASAFVGSVPEKLPLFFEKNIGQASPDVLYLSHGPKHAVSLCADGVFFSVPGRTPGTNAAGVRLALLGGNLSQGPVGVRPLAAKANYFKGADARGWLQGVPTFERVAFCDVYPGIDWVFHGTQRELEFDFVVRPGADPSRIVLGFEGAEKLEITSDGALVLQTKAGTIRHEAPSVYQMVNGIARPVKGRYIWEGGLSVRFAVAQYDPCLPLVIDPVVIFASYLGGSKGDYDLQTIGLDAAGNIYVGGSTESPDFPLEKPLFSQYGGDPDDVYIAKFDPTGSKLLFATFIGGDARDECKVMAVDPEGCVYFSGRTKSTNFPTTPGAFVKRGATFDINVVKLNATGDRLLYSLVFGGEGMEEARGIGIDPQGECLVVGGTHSTDLPTTPGSFQPKYRDEAEVDPIKKMGLPFKAEDAFVAKVKPDGSGFVYLTYLGGQGYDKAWGATLDAEGNAYVVGYTSAERDFPVTSGVIQARHAGGDQGPFYGPFGRLDGFLAKLSPQGDSLRIGTYFGGSRNDMLYGVDVDTEGNIYVAGHTQSVDIRMIDAAQPKNGGGENDVFITKLTPSADRVVFSTYLGGTGTDSLNSDGLVVLPTGHFCVIGSTTSEDFPVKRAVQEKIGGNQDGFVARYTLGGKLDFSTYIGGPEADSGASVVGDAKHNLFITGGAGKGFPVTPGAFQTQFRGGGNDSFLLKIALDETTTATKK